MSKETKAAIKIVLLAMSLVVQVAAVYLMSQGKPAEAAYVQGVALACLVSATL